MADTCVEFNRSGQHCGNKAMKGTTVCFQHNPDPKVRKRRKRALQRTREGAHKTKVRKHKSVTLVRARKSYEHRHRHQVIVTKLLETDCTYHSHAVPTRRHACEQCLHEALRGKL